MFGVCSGALHQASYCYVYYRELHANLCACGGRVFTCVHISTELVAILLRFA
jgi:hypothetical protein